MSFLKNAPILKQRRRELRHKQTETEAAFWGRVRNRKFNGLRFIRQYSLGPYILDFYCPSLLLAVELDGGQHNESESKEYDEARTEYLKNQGIEVLRFWNHEVLTQMDGVLAKIEERVNVLCAGVHNDTGIITPPSPSYLKRGGRRRECYPQVDATALSEEEGG
jgi:very-short-patch-repair endonuclease